MIREIREYLSARRDKLRAVIISWGLIAGMTYMAINPPHITLPNTITNILFFGMIIVLVALGIYGVHTQLPHDEE